MVWLLWCLAFGSGAPARVHEAAERGGERPSGELVSSNPESAEARKLSDHLNRRLPDWLGLSAEVRLRAEGRTGLGLAGEVSDAYLLSRIRVNLNVHPTRWLRLFVQGQDSRVVGIDPQRATSSVKDVLDFRQAFVHLSAGTEKKVGLMAGRQELKYGAERLVGPSNWSNTSRSFDAVRLGLATEHVRMDVFGSSVVEKDMSKLNRHRRGENFYGVYSTFGKVIPRGVLEPYFFYKAVQQVTGEQGSVGGADTYTTGFRLVSQSFPKAWGRIDFAGELALQWGDFAADEVSAWAGYVIVGYAPPRTPLSPRFSAEFSYASGDRDASDGEKETFDQLYPTNHSKYGIVDLVGWRNIQDLRVGTELRPCRRLGLAFDYHSFWLANRNDHLYNSGGSIAVRAPVGGASSRHVGQEVDVTAAYSLPYHVSLGAGLGYLFPGSFLEENSHGLGRTFSFFFVQFDL